MLAAGTQVLVLDLDSGTKRVVQVADLDVNTRSPWGSSVVAVGDAFVVCARPPQAKRVPQADGGPVTALDAGSGGGFYPSTSAEAYWVEELRGDARLEELDLDGRVARTVALPNGGRSIV